jgi:hypothetical protein
MASLIGDSISLSQRCLFGDFGKGRDASDLVEGQGKDLLEERGWSDLSGRMTAVSYSASRPFLWRRADAVGIREAQAAPAFCSADERAEYQLRDGLLTKSIWHDLQPSTFLTEQNARSRSAGNPQCHSRGGIPKCANTECEHKLSFAFPFFLHKG